MDMLAEIITLNQVVAIAALIGVDVITGIAAALVTGTFDIMKTANFLKTSVAPYFIVFVALKFLVALVDPGMLGDYAVIIDPVFVNASMVAIIGVLVNSILENIQETGLPIPSLQDLLAKTPIAGK